ncbi:MAG: L,D-transpeptidase family protein [Gemmatimonadota bacterium]
MAFGSVLLLTASGAQAQLGREIEIPLGTAVQAAGVATDAAVLPTEAGFAVSQLQNERVLDARVETRFQIKRLFHEKGIRYPAAEVFLRIFKRERTLELWVRPDGDESFTMLKQYPVCALAGELGPKRMQGDAQVPEGFYAIDFFNPVSDYHLSLHLDYPNQRDRLSSAAATDLGGEIFIHGGCNSEGCLALTDDGIKELYWVAVEARAVGQHSIPVHIFPARLEDEDLRNLQNVFSERPELGAFWQSLKPGYDFFEQNRRMPAVTVDASGNYLVNGVGAAPVGPLGKPLGAPVAGGAGNE